MTTIEYENGIVVEGVESYTGDNLRNLVWDLVGIANKMLPDWERIHIDKKTGEAWAYSMNLEDGCWQVRGAKDKSLGNFYEKAKDAGIDCTKFGIFRILEPTKIDGITHQDAFKAGWAMAIATMEEAQEKIPYDNDEPLAFVQGYMTAHSALVQDGTIKLQ